MAKNKPLVSFHSYQINARWTGGQKFYELRRGDELFFHSLDLGELVQAMFARWFEENGEQIRQQANPKVNITLTIKP